MGVPSTSPLRFTVGSFLTLWHTLHHLCALDKETQSEHFSPGYAGQTVLELQSSQGGPCCHPAWLCQ